ncbi:putative reverse transcriptase domain-containing protein [Tanacetum coccineum]
MTGGTPPPNPPKQPIDRAYSIASIKACIPTLLDLDKLNYNSWSALFQRFCRTYEVHHHLSAPPTTETSTIDPLHETNDSLVVMWIYATISPKLVEMVVDVDTSSVTDFFQDIKSKADRLANLDSPVKDTSLVTYAVNGIQQSDMSHPSVSPSLLHNTSSSPTVLVASSDKANTMSTSGFDVCRNFQRGSCSYGTRCKFVHGTRPPNSSLTTQGRVQSKTVPNIASKHTVPNTPSNSGQSCVAQYPQSMYSAQPTHMGYVYFNTGPKLHATSPSYDYASASVLCASSPDCIWTHWPITASPV